MDGSYRGIFAVQRAPQVDETTIIERGTEFSSRSQHILQLGGQHGRGNFGILDAESAAESAAAIEIVERGKFKPANVIEQAQRPIPELESAQAMATRVVGHPMREIGADILDLKPADVMMVAAHLGDLRAAKSVGLKTAFVARPHEYGPAGKPDLKADASVDVSATDFNDLATKLGV